MALVRIGKLTLAAGENSARDGVIDLAGGYLYVCLNTTPGKVIKIRLSDFSYVATLTFSVGSNSARAIALDSTHGYLYVACYSVPGRIVKVRISDFSEYDTLIFPAGHDNPTSLLLDSHPNILYAFNYDSTQSVEQIALSDFTVFSTLDLVLAGSPFMNTGLMGISYTYAYCSALALNRISRIRLSDFTEQGAVTQDSGTYSVSACIDNTRNLAFFGNDAAQSKIDKVDLDTFTPDGFLTLAAGQGPTSDLTANPTGDMFFTTLKKAPGVIVRVRISTFSAIDTFTLPAGDNSPYHAVLDEPNKNLYLGTDTTPAQIIKLYDADILSPEVRHMMLTGAD